MNANYNYNYFLNYNYEGYSVFSNTSYVHQAELSELSVPFEDWHPNQLGVIHSLAEELKDHLLEAMPLKILITASKIHTPLIAQIWESQLL